eukprot:COSAG05_NODE_66_length_22253_cov_14.954455_3_plen_465_part_00
MRCRQAASLSSTSGRSSVADTASNLHGRSEMRTVRALALPISIVALISVLLVLQTKQNRPLSIAQSDAPGGKLCTSSLMHGYPRAHIRLLVVTRWQDRTTFEFRLRKDIAMFVEPECFSVALLVDDEDKRNHEWADELAAEDTRIVMKPIPLPDSHETLFDGFGRGGVDASGNIYEEPIESRFGYERQQWTYFHADEFGGGAEIIGSMDSDGCVSTFLTHEDIINMKGKIRIHATTGDRWKGGDSIALNFTSEFDVMYTDTFPVFFWADTFAAMRAEVAERLGGEKRSFAHAFKTFNRKGYSQFNILANWAIKHQPERYELVLHCDTEAHGRNPRTVTLGAHKNFGWCNDQPTYEHSCATAFGNAVYFSKILARNGFASFEPAFPYNQPAHLRHEKAVASRVRALQPATRLKMARACSYYVGHTRSIVSVVVIVCAVGWCIGRRRNWLYTHGGPWYLPLLPQRE